MIFKLDTCFYYNGKVYEAGEQEVSKDFADKLIKLGHQPIDVVPELTKQEIIAKLKSKGIKYDIKQKKEELMVLLGVD